MKTIPPGMTFERALQSGMLGRIEDPTYLKWVRTLPCCCGCGRTGGVAHHMISRGGFKGMGTKVPDYMTMPMTHDCHQQLHQSVDDWEARNGWQMKHIMLTLVQYMATKG